MIIDLMPLNSGLTEDIYINENLSFSKEDLKDKDIIELKDVNVKGTIYNGSLNEYNLNLNVKGKMILPCSRTLKPTQHDFDIEITENIEENEENFKKSQKSIDIFPIIWENILMEIPIRIINPEAQNIEIKGDGWELITDSEK